MRALIKTGFLALTAVGFAACSNADGPAASQDTQDTLRAQILDANGNSLGVMILRSKGAAGTEVSINVNDISAGTHAMHFHEKGSCVAPDFKSAGGHYNPMGTPHGTNMPDGPHAGDMMNIEVAADGTGTFTVTNSRVSLAGQAGLPALLDADGSALILHEKADDYESQPSGAAGARIGCAVIGG